MSTTSLISSLFRAEIQSMSAYKVADAHGFIKLDAMENPYHWPPELTEHWLTSLRSCALNRYPDPEATRLIETLRGHDEIPESVAMLLGNGSDELIQLLLMALTPTQAVLAPAPSFVMYKQISQSLNLAYFAPSLHAEDFSLDIAHTLHLIQSHQPAIIFIAYPNNPTGNLFKAEDIHTIINASTGLVVIDEAYAPFANASFLPELQRYKNVLIMRTLSKLGLAGLRLGYLMGHTDIISQLNKIRLPYNINVLTQVTAEFALSHKHVFTEQTQLICQHRQWVFEQLQAHSELTVFPSAANFILFKTAAQQADRIHAHLKTQGVLIKNMHSQGGLMQDCLRVTIGTEAENKAFISALTTALTTIN
ncbi:MAG: histidinol-phosphate transaminase [Methylococcaceae bacterium]|nr:MAG: histidinol-phosphate transaminase [Methylococcaceae bacterium]